jgi:MFS family permease
MACISIYGVTIGLTTPLLSLILESRGVGSTTIGLNASMPAFGTLLAAPLIPELVARLGVRAFLGWCLLLDVLLILALPLFDTLYAWFVIRLLMGATATGLFVSSETWINEIAAEERRGRVMGLYNAVLAGTFALGPLLIPFTGIDGWLPFVIAAGFVVLAALPLMASGTAVPGIHGGASFGIVSFLRTAPSITAAVLLVAISYTATAALVPVFGIRNALGDVAAPVMLTVLCLGGVLLPYPIGWVADKVDRKLVLVLCGVASGLGALALPLSVASDVGLWVTLFLWGGAFSGLYTVAMTIVGQRFRGAELATAMAAFGVLWGVGSMLGPIVMGSAMDVWDPNGLPGSLAAVSFAFVGLALVSKDTKP